MSLTSTGGGFDVVGDVQVGETTIREECERKVKNCVKVEVEPRSSEGKVVGMVVPDGGTVAVILGGVLAVGTGAA